MKIQTLIQVVYNALEEPLANVSNTSHRPHIVEPKRMVCYIAADHYQIPLTEIADAFGYRDHTSVLSHRNRARGFASIKDKKFTAALVVAMGALAITTI